MKLLPLLLVFTLLALHVKAATFYVNATNLAPAAPFTNWPTAAADIQSAIDVATNGDQILVNDGVYQTGYSSLYVKYLYDPSGHLSRVLALRNRVTLTKAVTVQSVNGPAVTIIQGYQMTNHNNSITGDEAIRCAYLTNGACLSGFTLTNGASGQAGYPYCNGGGVWCESSSAVISNCVLVGNVAWIYGGGAFGGTFNNCIFAGNSNGVDGGGAAAGFNPFINIPMLNNCVLSNNTAGRNGGGSFSCTISNCLLIGNSAQQGGGGDEGGLVYNCILTNNSASFGGGGDDSWMFNCTIAGNSASTGGGVEGNSWLVNCVLNGNTATNNGGGTLGGELDNCLLINNWAQQDGGGAYYGGLYGCTIVSNSAASGGGIHSSWVVNSIIYFNTALDGTNNHTNSSMSSCCTMPLPDSGADNIALDPLFVDLANGILRLQSNSPCINAGNNSGDNEITGTDFDGSPRIVGGTVDIGAYEYQKPSSILSYAWAQKYGLPTDGSVDYLDLDGTGMNNWQKWIAGLNS